MKNDQAQIPFMIWIIMVAPGLAIAGGKQILGYNISGLAWAIPMLFSTFLIITRTNLIKFPILIWMPWIIILLIYLILSKNSPIQRTIQLTCPIVVGTAVSTLRLNDTHLSEFIKICKRFAIVIAFIAIFKTGLLLTGTIPQVTGLSAEGMTALLLCSLFATGYAMGNPKDILWWTLMAAFPVYAVTRTAIAVAGITLPLTFGPMQLKKRFVIIIAVTMAGLAIFYSARIQRKMFAHRGERGTLADVRAGEIHDSGRKFMWRQFQAKIKLKPWIGHGAGAGEQFTRMITEGKSGYPHNDWLLTLYDYGILGASMFSLCIIIAAFHAWKKSINAGSENRLLFLTGSFSFVIFILMMFTDNIMVYASFFGNLQFTILGLAYAAERRTDNS